MSLATHPEQTSLEAHAEQLGRLVSRTIPYARQTAPYALWVMAIALSMAVFALSSSAFVGLMLDNAPEREAPKVVRSMPPTPVLFAAKAAEPERLGTKPTPKPAAVAATVQRAALVEPAGPPQMIAVVGLAVRSHPQKSSAQVAALNDGELVTISGKQDGWILVTTADGESGWAYGKYLKPVDPDANLAADSPFWTGSD